MFWLMGVKLSMKNVCYFSTFGPCVLLLFLNYNINQLQKKKKKIYSDYTSLRELWRLIWKWYVCQALCLLFIFANSKVNPRTAHGSIQKEGNVGGKSSGASLCSSCSHWICPITYSQKTSGRKTSNNYELQTHSLH